MQQMLILGGHLGNMLISHSCCIKLCTIPISQMPSCVKKHLSRFWNHSNRPFKSRVTANYCNLVAILDYAN